jgi:ABC-type Zn uptake system ZnuABC Zn-binding protein ZnuA
LVLCCGLGSALVAAVPGCQNRAGEEAWPDRPGPKVLASFPPLYSFAANVGGEDAVVKCFLTTSGPHSHGDPSSSQIELGRRADLFLINGLGLDEGVAAKLKSRASGNWAAIDLGKRLDPKTLLEGECHHDHGHEHKHEEHEHGIDPHVWLDVKQAKAMVGFICDELKKRDPAHAAGYDQRAAAYVARLDALHGDGKELLKDKKQKKFISFHDSLRYFAQCYGLEVAGAIQVDPGVEPSAAKMKEIIDTCLKEGVTVIAVEPQFPTHTSAKAILEALRQKNVQAEFVEIDPLETATSDQLTPDLYERVVRKNLENLARVLK